MHFWEAVEALSLSRLASPDGEWKCHFGYGGSHNQVGALGPWSDRTRG